jgi:DNA processing protein
VPADERADLLAVLTHSGMSRPKVRDALAPLMRRGMRVREALDVLAAAPEGRSLGRTLLDRVTSTDALVVAEVATESAAMNRYRVSMLNLGQSGYPPLLAEIPDPPLALFVRGARGPLEDSAIAIVGSRRCASTSAMLATDIADGISRCGRVVVSGLASGVDGAAHRGALQAGCSTVAVLGHGHAHCYPAQHDGLTRRILGTGGALVSEYPPSWPPRPYFFPERNRIISGLTEAVLVVEASERSGSLITARLALEQGRDVLAVPGPVAAGAHRGCHRLLKDGAALVEGIDDVCTALGIDASVRESICESIGESPREEAGLTEVEIRLLDLTGAEGRPTEVLVELLGEPISRTLGLLTELELKGFVRAVGDGYIRRPSR